MYIIKDNNGMFQCDWCSIDNHKVVTSPSKTMENNKKGMYM